MKQVLIAADHAGFELKEQIVPYLRSLGYDVVDCGASSYEPEDDYSDYVSKAAEQVSGNPDKLRAIVLGGSGQGEAMVANRFPNVRAAVYYGPTSRAQTDADGNELNVLVSTREHNDANILSLGARFLDESETKEAVKLWLETPFSGEKRHVRRIAKLERH